MALTTYDQLLSKYSADSVAGILAENYFIADAILGPMAQVNNTTYQYRRKSFANVRRPSNILVNSGDATPQVRQWGELVSGKLKELRLEAPVTKDDVSQNPDGQAGAEREALDTVMVGNWVDWEARVVAVAATISNTGAAGVVWTSPSADPVDDIGDAMESARLASGFVPNVMAISQGDYVNLVKSSAVQNFVKGSSNALNTPVAAVEAALGSIYGRPIKIHIGAAVYNSAVEDGTPTITGLDLWTAGTVILMYQNPNPRAPRCMGGFYLPDEDNKVYTVADTRDPARGTTFVQHKLKRECQLIVDACGYRMTGVQ